MGRNGHRATVQILRQKLTLGRSHRAIAQSLGLSSGTVGATVLRARAAGLDWPQVEALTDDALEGRLYRIITGHQQIIRLGREMETGLSRGSERVERLSPNWDEKGRTRCYSASDQSSSCCALSLSVSSGWTR
jgi:hypothetical protein